MGSSFAKAPPSPFKRFATAGAAHSRQFEIDDVLCFKNAFGVSSLVNKNMQQVCGQCARGGSSGEGMLLRNYSSSRWLITAAALRCTELVCFRLAMLLCGEIVLARAEIGSS